MGSNLEDFDAQQFTILNWFMWTLAFSVTALRLIVRYRHLKAFAWDDAWVVIAMTTLTIMAVMNQLQRNIIYAIITVTTGGAPPAPFTTAEKLKSATILQMKEQFVFMMFFWTTLWSIKAALLIFYRKLFIGVNGYMKWWWAVVVVCILTWLMSVISNFMDCMPLRRRFSLDPKDTCPSSHATNAIYMATTVDIVSDILIMLLPIRLLIGLRISLKQKIGIGGIFCIGIIIVFFSIFRMVKVLISIRTNNPNGSVSLALWSLLEASVAVIVGSLPTLKTLITHRGDTGYSSSGRKPSNYGGGYGLHSRNANSVIASQSAKGPHIRLYDMPSNGVKSTVQAGYGSDEALHTDGLDPGKGGIRKTQEVSVSSRDVDTIDGREGASIDSFRHA